MTEIRSANRDHRHLTWPIVIVLVAVVLTFLARCGLFAYRCQVVNRHAGKNDRSLVMKPIGPEWVRRLWGNSSVIAYGNEWGVFAKPWGVDLDLSSARNFPAEIASVIACLSGLESIEELRLTGDGLTDADLLRMQSFRSLTGLGLIETRVTAAGLGMIAHLPNLSRLTLCNSTSIDDGALAHLARAWQLEELNLNGTSVTDVGIGQLVSLSKLQHLSLNDTAVTDAGLHYLRGLKRLKSLSLSNTGVTDAGVESLRQVMPELEATDD